MNKELISIVIPVYKVEQYVAKCLDSIIAQTYSNIEILIVDDGSPDNSGAICDEYATKDSRIKVFHIPNGGVAKARQLGVESSWGEYIIFVDPDDWLPEESVEILYSNMNDDEDIVIGSYTNYGKKKHKVQVLKECIIIDPLASTLCHDIYPTPWGKLFRRRLFGANSFPNFKKSQDWLMLIEISTRASKAKVISRNVYNYLIRDTSAARTHILDIQYIKSFIAKGKEFLLYGGLYDKYINDFYVFSLINYNRLSTFCKAVDRNNCEVKSLMANINYNALPQRGKQLYLCVKYPVYNFGIKIIQDVKWQIVNKLYYQ